MIRVPLLPRPLLGAIDQPLEDLDEAAWKATALLSSSVRVEDVIDHAVSSSVRLSHRGTAITLHMATIGTGILQQEAAESKLFLNGPAICRRLSGRKPVSLFV